MVVFVVPSLEQLLDSVLDSKPWALPLEIVLVLYITGLRDGRMILFWK